MSITVGDDLALSLLDNSGRSSFSRSCHFAKNERMSTGIYYFEGTASADGKTITQESSYDNPARGPTVWRSVTRIVDDNTLQYEMYLTSKGARKRR